jgi:predicted transcriptional regulator
MVKQIPVDDIVRAVQAIVIYRGDSEYIKGVVASGLMSDVLTTEEEGILLVSNLSTAQVIRTADMVGAYAILITNGKSLSEDMVDMARDLGISLLRTDHPMFETCYLLGKLMHGE